MWFSFLSWYGIHIHRVSKSDDICWTPKILLVLSKTSDVEEAVLLLKRLTSKTIRWLKMDNSDFSKVWMVLRCQKGAVLC